MSKLTELSSFGCLFLINEYPLFTDHGQCHELCYNHYYMGSSFNSYMQWNPHNHYLLFKVEKRIFVGGMSNIRQSASSVIGN